MTENFKIVIDLWHLRESWQVWCERRFYRWMQGRLEATDVTISAP